MAESRRKRYTSGVPATKNASLYRVDPHELPRYTIREAARYLRMPEATLKSWVSGRSYRVASGTKRWAPLIHRPDPDDPRLSFGNLIEAHVLIALRKQYRVKIPTVRTALDYARRKLGIDHVLLSKELRATSGNILLDYLSSLINVGKAGQTAMPEILAAYLERLEWDLRGAPARMFPLTRANRLDAPKLVSIDPRIAFGRPIVQRKAIKTSVIAERFEAGESISDIADDYDLEAFEVEEAIRYEAHTVAA
jgi:uncharacterized protein (DUF433 family)